METGIHRLSLSICNCYLIRQKGTMPLRLASLLAHSSSAGSMLESVTMFLLPIALTPAKLRFGRPSLLSP